MKLTELTVSTCSAIIHPILAHFPILRGMVAQ
ncbi:uncharacterized protein METZ01_LOCUS145508 [marine metagenome]|uniref:Uncharacterized protein n=1 Tax=marine metagenome TaxID=408172 RepID=A0A381ZU74_9ZZZZ